MMSRPTRILPWAEAVDIGHGRGRLAWDAAASLRRVDAELGRLADVNEAWRSPEKADENYRKYLAYKNGTGPAAPLALPAKDSIHCRGYAVDSDDWYDAAAAAVWRRNGWRQTARYNDSRDEPWHGEYFPEHDQNYGKPAANGAADFDFKVARTQEDDMFYAIDPNKAWWLILPQGGGKSRGVQLGGDTIVDGGGLAVIRFPSWQRWDALKAAVDGLG